MAVRLPFSRFWAIFICLHIFPYLWCFWSNFQTFLEYQYQINFYHCYKHFFVSSSYKIKQGFVFIFIDKSILDFKKYTLNQLVNIPIHDFLCFATYGCCHPCFSSNVEHLFGVLASTQYTK